MNDFILDPHTGAMNNPIFQAGVPGAGNGGQETELQGLLDEFIALNRKLEAAEAAYNEIADGAKPKLKEISKQIVETMDESGTELITHKGVKFEPKDFTQFSALKGDLEQIQKGLLSEFGMPDVIKEEFCVTPASFNKAIRTLLGTEEFIDYFAEMCVDRRAAGVSLPEEMLKKMEENPEFYNEFSPEEALMFRDAMIEFLQRKNSIKYFQERRLYTRTKKSKKKTKEA